MSIKDYLLTEKKPTSSEKGKIIGEVTKDIKNLLNDYYKENKKKYGEDEAQKIQWTVLDSLTRDVQGWRDSMRRNLVKKDLDPMGR